MKLIINADDIGFSKGVTDGIISAYEKGVVSSTTIMPTMPNFDYAIEQIKKTKIGCGVHLTLSAYSPLLQGHKTLLNKNGRFYRRVTEEVVKTFDLDEVYNEWVAQIEKVKSSDIDITHLDSHHHVHTNIGLQKVVQKLIDKYNLPIRGGMNYTLNNARVIPVLNTFYADKVSFEYFNEHMNIIKEYDVLDLMVHPAFLDDYLLENTSYNIGRKTEYDVLTDDKLRELFEKENITLCTYRDINVNY